VEIREILPPAKVNDAMIMVMEAERHRRAVVTEASGTREAAIAVAEGEKQAAILRAEGAKQAAVLRAEGEAQALGTVWKVAHGVDEKTIKEFARLYATTKPATIQWGNALDTTANAFPGGKAVAILRAITGNDDFIFLLRFSFLLFFLAIGLFKLL
jgi:regulator of protease activity HflC (stomatin/prohibitin superfamily)